MSKARVIDGPFTVVHKSTTDSPAWRAMSHGARSLFIALRGKLDNGAKNNGKVHLSQRDACRELGSSNEQICRWYRELMHYGFIVMTKGGCLGSDGRGLAPHWRITDCGVWYMKGEWREPTRDFLRWSGTKFRKSTPTPPHEQNPDAENRCGVMRKTGTPVMRKTAAPKRRSDAENRNIQNGQGDAENRSISSKPYIEASQKVGG